MTRDQFHCRETAVRSQTPPYQHHKSAVGSPELYPRIPPGSRVNKPHIGKRPWVGYLEKLSRSFYRSSLNGRGLRCFEILRLQCEPVQESEPTGQACEIVGQYQQANGNNEGAAEHFDSAKMSLESAVEGKELIQAEAGHEEG